MRFFSRLSVPALAAAVALLGESSSIHVPFRTPVTVHVAGNLTSANANVGDSVPIKVNEDVVIGGYVVIAKDADGIAKVSSVSAATPNSPGSVQLTFSWVRAVDGSKIGVTGTQSASGRSGNGGNDAYSTLNDTSNVSSQVGANQASDVVSRASSIFGSISHHVNQNNASVSQKQPISLEIRNPNGVTIVSSQKAAASTDDSDIK